MKWDIFVYSRGVEQNDGFRLRTAPQYITDDVIRGCQGFFNIRSKSEMFAEETMCADDYAWNNTFMFLPVKQYKCCLFIRAVRIESPENGEYIDDFQGRPTWSLEGVCCPYSKLKYFFANTPSILMWFRENQQSSLCTMFNKGKITDCIEIPEDYLFNPMCEEAQLPEKASWVMRGKAALNALECLSKSIACAAEPFPFFYGTYASQFCNIIGKSYGVKKAFSTITEDCTMPVDSFHDEYHSIRVRQRRTFTEKKEYTTRCVLNLDGKQDSSYTWLISEIKAGEIHDILSGTPVKVDKEKGVSMCQLIAEADSIRTLASNMGWVVSPYSDTIMGCYTFETED